MKSAILAVLPSAEDRITLKNILSGPNWEVRCVKSLRSRRPGLKLTCIGAVLTDAHLAEDRGWKDVFHELERISNPPPLIVADRLADEALWAEVLNLGGYDVLSKPFDAKEVQHALAMACSFRLRKKPS